MAMNRTTKTLGCILATTLLQCSSGPANLDYNLTQLHCIIYYTLKADDM